MRFTINLATRTYLDHRLFNMLAFAVIAVLAIITMWNVSRVSSNMGEQRRLNSEIAAIQSRLGTGTRTVTEAAADRQRSRIRFYNEIIERKNVSWLGMLEMFEDVTPEGISLSSLSPGKKQEEWKLEGRARYFKTVQQYLEKLESCEDFTNVMLLSHQNLTSGDKVIGIQFSISCKVVH